MIGFTIRILGNSLALYVAFLLVPGFIIKGGIKEYLIAGIFLGLLNAIIRPVLKTITLPIIILTLGLFVFFIDALLLWAVDYIFDYVVIQDVWALIWATVTIWIVNLFVSKTTKVII